MGAETGAREVKKRTGEPPFAADAVGRSLRGAGFNLLVADMEAALVFQRDVLAVELVYADADFALLQSDGARWMLHADHTYADHPMTGIVSEPAGRGAGVELRLYAVDPDAAESRARALDFTVLAGSADKPHGLRECYLIDADGYVWVPSRPVRP